LEIRSYRDLPQVWYQIQEKFRDEARPKSGVLRTREFTMKDSYSFDRDEEGLEVNYRKHSSAYHRIFRRCGLRFYQVESDPGMMGGATAHEFMAPSPAGEDTIVLCTSCEYSANTELARSEPLGQQITAEQESWELEDIPTPEKRTVEEVSGYLNISPSFFIKSLLLVGRDGPFLALVRGDQELHEKKLMRIVGEFRPAEKDEVREITGVEAGFIGPQGSNLPKIADVSLRKGRYISGANKAGFHTRGISPSVHFQAEWQDIHVAAEGDGCPECGADIRIEKAIEIGNIFKLGIKYSLPLRAVYLDENGSEKIVVMGSYGIGPARIAAAAIEQNHDERGICWPEGIAPFDVEIIPLNMDEDDVLKVSGSLYEDMEKENIEALLDDRDMRPGVKFKDADLIGIPWHVIVGKRTLSEGFVELKSRKTGQTQKVAPSEAVGRIRRLLSPENH
jgi:prolyl-tRNA synthetase